MAENCSGVTGNNDTRCLCNEGNLGPKDLAKGSSPAALLRGYRRTGNLTPAAFLEKWCTMISEPNGHRDTKWHWPNASHDGFLLDTSNNEISGPIVLEPGTLIDRFGHDDTVYFAPLGTPFAMRSLPPSSLNDEYAVYEVLRRLEVRAGPIAPGFEQVGLGTQFICVGVGKEQLFGGMGWLRKLRGEEVEGLYR